MRRVSALLVAAGLIVVSLTGCSAAAGSNCVTSSGSASNLVEASGKFGSELNVTFPTPLQSTTTQRTELIHGKGAPVAKGQLAQISYNLFDAKTGKSLGHDSTHIAISSKAIGIKGLAEGLQCSQVGSRVAVVIPASQGGTSLGASGTAVAVVDIKKSYLTAANGAPQPSRPGFPTVVLAPNGQPGIKVPTTTPPKSVQVETLKKGNGRVVKKDDIVAVQYTGVLWSDNTVFESSWQNGSPIGAEAGKGSTAKNSLVSGAANALIGQSVGSQIVVIVPPSKGYGSQGSGSVPANATLAYVIDILGIA